MFNNFYIISDIEQKYLDLQHESELAHAVEIDEKYMSPVSQHFF